MRNSGECLARGPHVAIRTDAAPALNEKTPPEAIAEALEHRSPRRGLVWVLALGLVVVGIGALVEAFADWGTFVRARWIARDEAAGPARNLPAAPGDRVAIDKAGPTLRVVESPRQVNWTPSEMEAAKLRLAAALARRVVSGDDGLMSAESDGTAPRHSAPSGVTAALPTPAHTENTVIAPAGRRAFEWREPDDTRTDRVLEFRDTVGLLKRGEGSFNNGDLAGARPLLRRLAEERDAKAALLLASTYDPLVLKNMQVYAFAAHAADIAMARAWYQRAHELGSSEALLRLEALARINAND